MKTKFGKIIAGVALLFCAYGAGGCHGDLDIMQDNKLSASNMWKEESDATSATYGLYVYLRSALKSMNDIYLCWGELRNGLWGPGTHNTLNGVDQSQVRTSTMSSVNEYADWTALYTTVNQANLVIRHVPAMGLKEKPRAFCLGNAHFVRAYCFFQIARIWGDAPLPLWGYESTDTELFLGRTPVSEVLMRVERDIADAERYVADTSDKTVATPAAVAMLKADYALWMYRMQAGGEAYLAMAQEALGELGLSDALLEPAYADIFSSSNKCGREVIFAVHQDVSEALNGPAYYLGWNESYVEAAYRNNPVPTTGGNQWWWYTDTYRALLQADPADTRAALTCRTADYGTGGRRIGWTEKLMGRVDNGTRIFDSDFILYRYGEAFLMAAEARYYGKDYAGALEALAPLAARAYGRKDYYTDTSPEVVLQAIVDAQAGATTAGSAKAGDILLAEDFSRVIHGGDIANFAAGYYPPTAGRGTYAAASGDNPPGFSVTRCTANEFDVFSGGGVAAPYTEGTGLSAWGKSGNIAGRPGYVKMGAGSAAATLYTPELTALPDAATVKVRFSAQAYSEKYDGSGADAGKILVKAVRGAVLGAKGAITGTVTEVSAADPVDISAAKARFREFEATLTNVTPDCRIVISTSEKRALLDNVVVTCTAITPATKPAAPGGVSFDAAAAADRLTLKWNAVPDATSYTVAYWKGSASAPESEYAYKTGIASTATSQELTNLESNTSYWAKVKAVGSLDSDWSETANATTMDSGGEPLLPTADLLDVVFRNDGSAMDNSPSATPVRALEGTAMMTYYNDLYSRYAAHFNHTPGTSVNEGFYKADYSANKQFQDALADGHTLEALFKLDEKSDGSAELKMFSSMSSGGTGFLISKADKGTELTFLPNVSTTGKSNWIWTKSGINPEAGRYYHVVGVWNKQEAKTYIYVDGELKGTMDAPGNYVPPTTTTSYWFGIGVDASATVGQNAWKGDVAIARVYDAPLTAEKVKALWETVKRDQQPAAINITGLLYLSGCEVGADYTYTLYGKGFAAGDRIRFEPLAGSAGTFTLDGSAAAESLSVRIPNGFASGRYRMVLMRGQNQYPLGITQLTYSNNPARVAKPRVIAHRGYHKDGAAQNSVAALAKAQELGIYGSEFDVWITADGKVVINHDSTVPGSSLVIENVNYDQIKDLTLANGEKLPTLDDYLEQATKNADTKLILEIKRHSSAANNARAADAVIEAVKAKGLTDRVEYIAFDYTTCKRIVNALPGAMVQYLNGDLAPAAVRQDGIGGIDYRFSAYSGNPGWVKEAHANGMVTNVWTVDTVQDMMTCIAWGMDFITTNNPETLKELLTRTFVSAN